MAPAPVLRLAMPAPPTPARLTLVPSPFVITPAAPTVAVATAVGILGTPNTRVAMVPAPLYLTGRVDITQFRVSIAAGVW